MLPPVPPARLPVLTLSPSAMVAPPTWLSGPASQAAALVPVVLLAPPALQSAPQLGEHALGFRDLIVFRYPGPVLLPGAGGQGSGHVATRLAGTQAAVLAAAASPAPASALAGHVLSRTVAAAAEETAGGAAPQKLRHRSRRRSSSLCRLRKLL